MSLINQVLHDLEKRGASTNIGEATIRVVPQRKRYVMFWSIFALLAVSVLLLVAWSKWNDEFGRLTDTQAVPASLPVAAGNVADVTVAASSVADTQPVATHNAGVAEKPLALVGPVISAVTFNTPDAAGPVSAVTINGNQFAADATLILRTPKNIIFTRHKIVSQSADKIVFNANFANKAGPWSIEVVNPGGHSSGVFVFAVQAAAIPAGVQTQGKEKAALPETKNTLLTAKPAQADMMPKGINKRTIVMTPRQQAENEYRKAYNLLQLEQTQAALSGFETALQLDAGHVAARQALLRLLLESKRTDDAERLLQEGLQHDPKQSNLALLLARMQVGRNAHGQALETMEKSLPYAAKQADYQAFVAALLQRQNRHQEAIGYFQNALRLNAQSGVWLMGLGISLHAEQRNSEAREAFNRALETRTLSNELQQFVTQQLKEL